jgi:hypothetical protein
VVFAGVYHTNHDGVYGSSAEPVLFTCGRASEWLQGISPVEGRCACGNIVQCRGDPWCVCSRTVSNTVRLAALSAEGCV